MPSSAFDSPNVQIPMSGACSIGRVNVSLVVSIFFIYISGVVKDMTFKYNLYSLEIYIFECITS